MVESGIIIGGSPSTGSSVLVNILNRHPDLVSGPETYLFIHPKLYRDWNSYRGALQTRRLVHHLCSEGWLALHGALLNDPFYGWEAPEVQTLIRRSASLPEFAQSYFGRSQQRSAAQQWLEKSPSNVIAFPHFLQHFPDGKVIHTVRNPLDTMASLYRRGLSAYYAAGAYLVNNALALRVQDTTNYFRMDYERWVEHPRQELQQLLQFLGFQWMDTLLEADTQEVRMSGWQHNEHGQLSSGSVGSFFQLPERDQQLLISALNVCIFSRPFREHHQLPFRDALEVCYALGYQLPKVDNKPFINALKKQQREDRWARIKKLYPTGFSIYPFLAI